MTAGPSSPRFLDGAAVERHLTPSLALEAMDDAFRSLARGRAVQPLRTLLTLPEERSGPGPGAGQETPESGGRPHDPGSPPDGEPRHLLVMPGYLGAPAALGAKLLTLFPGNHALGIPSHQGVVLLFDVGTGSLRAVVDAEAVTALRTAAASALATRLLAREDADELAILGSGVQARSHLQAILGVRPIRRVRIWSRTPEHARAFVAEAGARMGKGGGPEGRPPPEVVHAPDPETAVRGAGIVCTVTASPTPVLRGAWLAPGTHVNAVGAYTRDTRELDSAAVQRARLYVDRRESARAEAGDFLLPLAEGAIRDSHLLGELGELLEGRVEGRTSAEDVTLFKSLGLAVQDLAAVAALVERMEQAERGTTRAEEAPGLLRADPPVRTPPDG